MNYEYNITGLDGDMVTQSNAITLPMRLNKKNYVHNYFRNCHSFQCNTIKEAIAIFDHEFADAIRKWLYTAVARATDLKNMCYSTITTRARRTRGR